MSDEKSEPKKTTAENASGKESTAKKSIMETLEPYIKKVEEYSIGRNYVAVIKKWTNYAGRAGVREFWLYAAVNICIGVALAILGSIPILGILFRLVSFVYSIAVIIPSFTVGVRRLHDTNRSGWMYLLGLIPLVGWIIVIVFLIMKGTPGENKYGPVPEDIA